MQPLPSSIIPILEHFSTLFLKHKTYAKAILLIVGAILCKGGRTVCAVLKVLGMHGEKRFDKYHRVLSRDKWSAVQGAKILLNQIVDKIDGPIVIAIDEHIERRNGKKIKAKGCYRDPIRSSKACVVKCFGLKWITVMVLKKFSWAKRTFALPFLTVLTRPKKKDQSSDKRHKTAVDYAIQIMMQIRRWLPNKKILFVGDGGFANASLAWHSLKYSVSLITRLRLDARLFDFPKLSPGPGRPTKKGDKLLTPKQMFQSTDLIWNEAELEWYGGVKKTLRYVTFTCLWHVISYDPVPIRVILLKDPEGKYEQIPLMSTDVVLDPITVIESFVSRWNQEVTHREVKEHLGVETQRQWSDLAIARTTPVLFALYSLVILMANALNALNPLASQETAWYKKDSVTFSDALRELRRQLWQNWYFKRSKKKTEPQEIISKEELTSLINQLAEVA